MKRFLIKQRMVFANKVIIDANSEEEALELFKEHINYNVSSKDNLISHGIEIVPWL